MNTRGSANRRPGAVKAWPVQERPRERLNRYGPGAMSDAELLVLLLGAGGGGVSVLEVVRKLMVRHGSPARLAGLGMAELSRIRGIGPAGAARMVAAFELGRRAAVAAERRQRIRLPADVFRLLGPKYRDLSQERFGAVLLDSGNNLIQDVALTLGTLNASLVHPREVFKAAVDYRAAGIILIHNHPSGDPAPSAEDQRVTRQLMDASRIMGIPVLDHVILAGNTYYSFAENGLVK
ncbi:MAG TPA: DNA repair protein RadC [bacterium]|nr:DNA repair protein RadC [bacterium]